MNEDGADNREGGAATNGKELYVVHAIDTEGPLYESIGATFERLESILGVRLEPSRDTLDRVRRGELDLGGREEVAQRVVSRRLLDYNDTWDKIDAMLDEMMSSGYRRRYADSEGGPWAYSWFVMDHVGYVENPRRRDVGWHNIYDHYRTRTADVDSEVDELHWHFHPASTYGEGHVNATSYLRSPHLMESLARRTIDRHDFPSCFRPGFHVERPDSHWFLEQWIPFDFANQAMPQAGDEEGQDDLVEGRFGDWRRAPNDWSPYHPSHDDYQRPGTCERVIFRCLNVGTRLRLLTENDVERAFRRASTGKPTILAFTNHDFRDMRPDVDGTHAMLQRVAERHRDVVWRNAGARHAARAVLGLRPNLDFALRTRIERAGRSIRLHVDATSDTFGPQPLLAVRTRDRRYLTDNLDVQEPRRSWTYVFDEHTIRPESIDAVGLATNDRTGATYVGTFDSELRVQYEATR